LRRWEAITGLIQTIVTMIILISTKNILYVIVGQQVWILIMLAQNHHLLKKKYPEIKLEANIFEFGRKSRAQLLRILAPTWRSGLGIIFNAGGLQLSGIIAANTSEAEVATQYFLVIRLITGVAAFSQVPFYSQIPALARIKEINGEIVLIKRGFGIINQSLLIYTFGVTIVWIVLSLYSKIALGNFQIEIAKVIYWTFALGMFFERTGALLLQMQSLTNNIKWHIANGITVTLYFVILLSIHETLEILAFPVAFAISNALFYLPYTIHLCLESYKSVNYKLILSTTLWPVLAMTIAFTSSFYFQL
jgi:hypothetical protein